MDGSPLRCVVAGKAELNGVSASVLNEEQRAELQKAYAAYNQVLDVAAANAGVIAETYNSVAELLKAVREKAKVILDKIAKNESPTKSELNELEKLSKKGVELKQKELEKLKLKAGADTMQYVAKLSAWIAEQQQGIECVTTLKAEQKPISEPKKGGPSIYFEGSYLFACDLSNLTKPEPVNENKGKNVPEIKLNSRVILIGGANLSINGTDISEETKSISAGIDKSKLFNLKTLNLFQLVPDQVVFPGIIDEIRKDYRQGQKIILYGYSMGGVGVLRMARGLNESNIPVALLITVDASYSRFSDKVDRSVPKNVIKNFNYFQTNETSAPPLNSFGGPNTGNPKAIQNFDQSKIIYKQKIMNHSDIDEYNINNVINAIN